LFYTDALEQPMILTDKNQYLKLARTHNLVPVARRVPADTETPVSTYLKTARGPWPPRR
jgi:hypothetical protein